MLVSDTNTNMEHIKVRIKVWQSFFRGEVNFFDATFQMLPARFVPYPIRCAYERKTLEYQIIKCNQYHIELIKDNSAIVDAGANLGVFSIFVAKKHPNCTIYAFEPTPRMFAVLKKNTKKYPNIRCFNYALGNENKTVKIVEVNYNTGSNHISDHGIPVQMKTIDSLDIPMDFLRMDVEGYEANVLRGAAETIKKHHPIIAMSAYHKPEDKTELPKILNQIAPYDCELRHDCEEDFICKPK